MTETDSPVLVAVSVDPETSHRANEAVRIALGILAGENEVVIAFLGVFAFNYVFTQTLLATHPEITVIR